MQRKNPIKMQDRVSIKISEMAKVRYKERHFA